MSAGILLTVAGVWVLAQVLRGNALGRLGITGEPSPTTSDTPPATTDRPMMPQRGGPFL
ncbi:MAG TPA: hypothetical protein VF163_02255 [Micromonosporaceae bacterium]